MDVFELLRCALIPGFFIAVIGLGYFFKKSRDLRDQIDCDPHVWNVACDHAVNELVSELAHLGEGCSFVIEHEVRHVMLAHDLKGCFFCNDRRGE